MAVDRKNENQELLYVVLAIGQDETGQSILEFLISLPVMVGMLILLIKVNTVIQMSIVDQQYARAQGFFITYNNREYPRLRTNGKPSSRMDSIKNGWSQMTVGVAGNPAPDDGGDYAPAASTYSITRQKTSIADPSQAEPDERAKVRVRDTFTLCSQLNGFYGSAGFQPFTSTAMVALAGPGSSSAFKYCGSPITR